MPTNLALILQAITTLSIFAGVIFTIVQLRAGAKQRARDSAIHLIHSFRTPEFLHAVNIVFDLPEGLSRKEIESRLGERITAILVMFGTFENLGILVCKREIDIRLVDDFFSGIIILAGKKFRKYLAEVRASGNRDTYFEWFQWLYEQFEKRESKEPAVPAYVAFKDWKP